MIVPFEAGGLRYEFEEDTWRRIYAGDWDDERTPPLPVLREIIRLLQARLALAERKLAQMKSNSEMDPYEGKE